jgi:hypothetical protein
LMKNEHEQQPLVLRTAHPDSYLTPYFAHDNVLYHA